MAKYGSDQVTIEIDDTNGTPVDLSAYITSINGFDINAITEENTPFGAGWVGHLAVGVKEVPEIVVGGFYDDTASTGPVAVLGGTNVGATRTFTLDPGGSGNDVNVEAIIRRFSIRAISKELTKFECALQPTGAVS